MDLVSLWRVLAAFAFVIGLLLVVAKLIKYFGIDKRIQKSSQGEEGLEVTGSLYLDPKRRVVVVARDKQKHLLLLSENSDILLETFTDKK